MIQTALCLTSWSWAKQHHFIWITCHGQTKCLTITEASRKCGLRKWVGSLRVHQSYLHCLQQLSAVHAHLQVAVWIMEKATESNPPWMDPWDFGWTQVASRCIQPYFRWCHTCTPDALLKVIKCSDVLEISSAGQTCVDADNLTLHVQCFVNVREAPNVSMIRQGRLYRLMMMMTTTMTTTTTMMMMTTRYDILLFILVMRGTIRVYFHIYESIFFIYFIKVTNIVCNWQCKISPWSSWLYHFSVFICFHKRKWWEWVNWVKQVSYT